MADPRSGRKWFEFTTRYWEQFGEYNPPCALCGEIVNTSIRGRLNPWSRSVDHIIPVESGGKVYDLNNVQGVHRLCNTSRGSKPMSEFDTPRKRQSFRKVVEALAVVQEVKREHTYVTAEITETPAQQRPWAPWGWYSSNEGVRPNGEYYYKCCDQKPTNTNILHECPKQAL